MVALPLAMACAALLLIAGGQPATARAGATAPISSAHPASATRVAGAPAAEVTAGGTALAATAETLSIFAGTGNFGPPTPGPATSSDLDAPSGIAVNPATGDVYIADVDNNDILQVTPSGTLSIFAGTGTLGAPTPGPATSSDLNDPGGVAVDPATGNVYIADTGNEEVEQVTPSGTLSIFAGTGTLGAPTPGPATSSDLEGPQGVAVDSATGDLYIADSGNADISANSEILRVTPTGTLSIFAGTGKLGLSTPGPATHSDLNRPYGVAVDPATADVYIADAFNEEVERVTATGTLSIFAGTGKLGLSTPGPATHSELCLPYGVAVDPATGDVYIANIKCDEVDRVTPTWSDELTGGQRLTGGEELVNNTSDERLVLQSSDGNLVLYRGSTPIWTAATAGHAGDYLAMQASDGNLVVYSKAGKAIWSARTAGHPGDRLILQGDGNLVVYTSAGRAIWASGTNR